MKIIIIGIQALIISVFATSVSANNIASGGIIGIHSTTFDGPISASNPSKIDGGSAVSFNSVGTAHGGITEQAIGILKWNGDKAYLGAVLLPDMDIVITSGGLTTVAASGATLNLKAPVTDNSSGSFFVDGGSNIVADVSSFSDVTVSCSGIACPGIPFLNLDGLSYTLDGNITPAGGDTVTLNLTTNNGSLLRVEVVTEPLSVLANVASVEVLGIHSTTFDGPISASNPSKLDGGSSVSFVSVGTDNGGITETGTGVIEFDGDKLHLAAFLLPDLNVVITSGGLTTVETANASIHLSTPMVDNTSGSFSADGGSNVIADFSAFSAATVSCSGIACPGIPFLNLDGLSYTLEGNITPEGGDTLVLVLTTNNGSLLKVQIVTEVANQTPGGEDIPMPGIALLLLAGIVGLVASRSKKG